MNFHVVHAFILCFFLGQVCSGGEVNKDFFDRLSAQFNEARRKKPESIQDIIKGSIRRRIIGVGEQFLDDFTELEQNHKINIMGFPSDKLIHSLHKIRVNDSKIDVNQIKQYQSKVNNNLAEESATKKPLIAAFVVDFLKLAQSIWSKQLPAERYNGIINLEYAMLHPNATTDELDSALNYLYGVDIEATKTSFVDSHNFPALSENDCPGRKYSKIDELKTFVDLKPKVMQDFIAISKKFPCNDYTYPVLDFFIHAIKQWHGDESKINACRMKENPVDWDSFWYSNVATTDHKEAALQSRETILSARLPDETFRGIFDFVRATIANTPIDQIEKALEYLYEDVPKTDCTESSTLKNE